MHTRFSTITNKLMFLEEPVPVCKQVSKILEILPRSWTNEFVIGDETRDPEVVMLDALFELLQVHELHRKREGLILKGKDKRRLIRRKKIMTRLPAQVKCVASVINQVTPLETYL